MKSSGSFFFTYISPAPRPHWISFIFFFFHQHFVHNSYKCVQLQRYNMKEFGFARNTKKYFRSPPKSKHLQFPNFWVPISSTEFYAWIHNFCNNAIHHFWKKIPPPIMEIRFIFKNSFHQSLVPTKFVLIFMRGSNMFVTFHHWRTPFLEKRFPGPQFTPPSKFLALKSNSRPFSTHSKGVFRISRVQRSRTNKMRDKKKTVQKNTISSRP